MKLEATHELIVLGPDFERCNDYLLRFFAQTPLVHYDTIHVEKREALPATHPSFWERVDKGIEQNRQAVEELLHELKGYGFETIEDLFRLEQGFQSKIFHTAAHLLDGFFGVDTYFYSLVHDSHWLTELQRKEITGAPEDYWLLKMYGALTIKSGSGATILRSYED